MTEVLIDSELLTCPICADIFADACDTGCGHTFCEFCLNSCLESKPDKCPVCSKNPIPIHPSFTIRSLCSAIAPIVKPDESMTVDSEKQLASESYHLQKYAQAIVHYNNAINRCTNTLDPKYSYLFNNRSQCFIHLRQYKRALDDCEEALRTGGDNIKAFMRKGLCHRQLGQFEESRIAYNKAAHLDVSREWEGQIKEGMNLLPIFQPKPGLAPNQSQQPQQQRPQSQTQPQQQQRPQSQTQQQQQQYYYTYQAGPYGNNMYPNFNSQHARYSTNYPGQYRGPTQQQPQQPQQQQQQPYYPYYNNNNQYRPNQQPNQPPNVYVQQPQQQSPQQQPPQQPQNTSPQPTTPATTNTSTNTNTNTNTNTTNSSSSSTSSSKGRSRSNSNLESSSDNNNSKKNCKQQ